MYYAILARDIKNKADSLIKKKSLDACLKEFGEIVYTGSYALNLMTWKDIDIQLRLFKNLDPITAINSIISYMIKDKNVIHIEYTSSTKNLNAKMPEGFYLQFKIKEPDEQDIYDTWKIDVWILNEKDFSENRIFMNDIERKLNKNNDLRSLILKMKYEVMNGKSRPPKMASYFIYQAILFHNINESSMVKKFLIENGVQI